MFLVHLAAVVREGVEAALHAERQQDAAFWVIGKGGVLGGQALPHPLFDAVGKHALLRAGEQDVHSPLVRHKGPEQIAGQRFGLDRVQLHCRDAGQDVVDELILQPAGQCIDILIMGIEGRFVHTGQRTQVLDFNLFQGRFAAQFQESLLDGAVGFFDADVQK